MYVIHISGDTVKILEGSFARRKISVNSLYSVAMPSDYLDTPEEKGYEKLEAVIINGLRDLGENFKNKKVRIVLDNINIPFREMIVPTLDRKKTIELVKNEIFSDEKLAGGNTVDYIETERKVEGEKQSRILVTYVDNIILSDMQKLCKNLMMRLLSIDVGQNCTAKLLRFSADSLPPSYIFTELRDSTVIISLIMNGEFKYCITKSVISMQSMRFKSERTYFVNDITNTLRNAADLFRKQYPEFECKEVVVAGSAEKLELMKKPVGDKLNANVRGVEVPDNVENVSADEYNDFFCTIGGLIREG